MEVSDEEYTADTSRIPICASAEMNDMVVSVDNFLLQVRHKRWRRPIAILLIPLILAACGKQTFTSPPMQQISLPLIEGKPFPLVMLKTLSGESVPLQSFQGKMLVLNVWATWCPPCRREMPSLERLSRTLDSKRFVVLGLSIDKDELLASEFLRGNHITFVNYFDGKGKITQQLGLQAYPETFLIAQDGTLVKRVAGLQDWSSPDMIRELEDYYQLKRRRGSDIASEGK